MTASPSTLVYETSPFWRRKLNDAGVRPQDVAGIEDLPRLPFCTRAELDADQAEHPPFGEYTCSRPGSGDAQALHDRAEAVTNMLRVAEVANRHKLPLRYHTGIPMGYTAAYSYGFLGPANSNPLWGHDIAAAFPDLVLIFDHGGIQAWWWERWYEECLNVVGAHDNVYVETGLWWRELYEKPLVDPNIGPEKLLWGTDWGASMQIYSQLGRTPPSYPVQLRKEGIVHYQVDYWGWSLRELTSLRLSQDDMNLILGGNAARIFNLDVPYTRLFKPPSEHVGRRHSDSDGRRHPAHAEHH